MPFARFLLCLALMLLCGAAAAQDAQHRVALVIGNSAYARAPLANPVNDARLIAAKLKAQGFEVFASYDASQRDMKRAVQTFAATLRARGKDVAAFIFYAGHGVQVKGENYLIPVDAKIDSEGDVDIDAVSLSSIMSMLENTETRLSIVVLDACRDNPFGYARGTSRGLARVDAPSGSLVAFSTAPGKAAVDGPAGGNSFYSAALAQAMDEPGLKIEEVFKRVRIAVRERTNGGQTPWESTSLTGDFYPAGAMTSERPQQAASKAVAETPETATAPMRKEEVARPNAEIETRPAETKTAALKPELPQQVKAAPWLASIPVALSPTDVERLSAFEDNRKQAIAEGLAGGDPPDRAELQKVLAGEPQPVSDSELLGEWRCRTLKLGGMPPPITVYSFFKCRIFKANNAVILQKTTGSQRTRGALYRVGGDRLAYIGAGTVNDDPVRKYGDDPKEDEVGLLVKAGPRRMRLEFPAPHYESHFDIMELVR
jgi:hypothetical protein